MPTAPFFYLIVEDNKTATLASTPRWGRALTGVPAAGEFQMTSWQQLPHVLIFRLAQHAERTLDARSATCCVVASPAGSNEECGQLRKDSDVADRIVQLGQRTCPGRPIVVVDGPDADGTKDAVCHQLWSARSCARGGDDPLVRLTGNAPGIQSEVRTRLNRGSCRRLEPTPYLSHARSPLAAAQVASGRRRLRIAYAAASWGHIDAEAHGFVAWRKALRNACKTAARADAARCNWVWISMSGQGAEQAVRQYAQADFCLQPPGDTLPRPGMIDSLSVGCVPVLFHPAQATLWPLHWPNVNRSSLLFDWTSGAPRPKTRAHAAYAERAKAVVDALLRVPDAELRALRKGVAEAATTMLYAAKPTAATGRSDAIDLIVRQMRPLRLLPDAAERSRYAQQLAARTGLLEAQRVYERGRQGRP